MSADPSPVFPWPRLSPNWTVRDNEVHVFAAETTISDAQEAELYRRLSSDEQRAIGQIVAPQARRQSIVARGMLRQLLARLSGVSDAEITIVTAKTGKPRCESLPTGNVHFNISHRDGLALLAISLGSEVGVDVERVCDRIDIHAVAEVVFTPGERDELLAAPKELQRQVFFQFWTRKEALLKAIGVGLIAEPNQFDVRSHDRPVVPAEFCAAVNSSQTPWRIQQLDLPPGYVGALVCEAGIHQTFCWHFQP